MWQPVIEVGGGLLVPLVRDRFYVPHPNEISRPQSASALLGTASIGAGFSFQ